jgi:AcrR family transcriptional regulator
MNATRAGFHHGDLAQAALLAAAAQIRAAGAQSLTWRGLAEQLGVNHRALYRHFTDREDIVVQIANQGFEQLAKECAGAIVGLTPPHAFRALMTAYVDFAYAEPKMYELMFSLPLKEEMAINTALGQSLKTLTGLALSASKQAGDTSSMSRDRVIQSMGQAHGLIMLFRSGVFDSKSPLAAKKYILGLINSNI